MLHEAGYRCGNPACHSILILDIHHIERVADDGGDAPENLLPLCPNCHALHHKDVISVESVRAWKMLLMTINEAYDRKTIDVLAALSRVGQVFVSGDGLLACAVLVAGELVNVREWGKRSFDERFGFQTPSYGLNLTQRGEQLLQAWRAGDQSAAVVATSTAFKPTEERTE